MPYRVIALDLDGTLLTPQKTILPESLEALKRAREAGYQVLIVTGRHHVAIHPFYQALALDTPAICCNGTYLYDYHAKNVLASNPMPAVEAQQLIDVLEQHQVHGLMYVDNAMLYQLPTGHVLRTENWARSLPEHQRPVFLQVPSLRDAAQQADAIWKFALTDADLGRLHEVVAHIEEKFGFACEWSWHDQVDVALAGNSKGNRLAQWVESQGMTMQDVVAFGDNYNDLSMLERAGLGIAMGNADQAIKDRVNTVIGLNTEPSIAEAIYQHLL
ncbi:pyridoxal phosphatase [Atlantibacter subterraneus]|uniref:Pyridoxal phosphatase n=1 Tax=Atlantibacter subterraneus TaxID=255519 RepID=A0ABU4DYY6_9ENTR|nr:pyridoxal phosphatase [Atlantibacter subterranea]MDZ5664298.1 pyridoxal phosphatase [Atlantibacter hermannii]QFH72221.1 pyridoxal phosphatase [Enterobacter sp. E76]MDV7021604.1 pyridoxal phosphatase [Atlantibacter subterranea]MDW2741535.1 pyridoxal phosphatase [Atlantibacter subterranea]TSJ59031.1 pyridoxal phosphatase [Atlantibacter subterranea]